MDFKMLACREYVSTRLVSGYLFLPSPLLHAQLLSSEPAFVVRLRARVEQSVMK